MAEHDSPSHERFERDVADFNEGMALLKANRLDEAVRKFREAATTGEDRPMEHYALAVALHRNGQWEEARAEIERFLSMSPKANTYVAQARAILPIIERKLADQRREVARQATPPGGIKRADVARAVEAAARPADSLLQCAAYEKGINAYLRGDYAEAEESFQEALGEMQDVASLKHVYNNLGLTYHARHEYDTAIRSFEKALSMDSGFLEARNNLGLAWNDCGMMKAVEAFEAVLRADPNFFDALVNLGSLYYRKGDLPAARRTWERAHALRPTDAQVQRNLAVFR
jgi:tetratricopeptide (TPR) repeat protein